MTLGLPHQGETFEGQAWFSWLLDRTTSIGNQPTATKSDYVRHQQVMPPVDLQVVLRAFSRRQEAFVDANPKRYQCCQLKTGPRVCDSILS
jgi:hypothetical protein